MLDERQDVKRYAKAMDALASALGTAVNCCPTKAGLFVEFQKDDLNFELANALLVVENLVKVDTEQRSAYLDEQSIPEQRLTMPDKPLSEFFARRIANTGELPWFEVRALASIGAGLLMRHQGDPKAIKKLERLAVPLDGFRRNESAKAMSVLLQDAAGGPYDDLTDQDWVDLADLAGYKPEDMARLMEERESTPK